MDHSIALSARHTIDLYPVAPFHFDASMHKPDHFPSADNAWTPSTRWQTMRWQDVPLGLKFEDRGDVDDPLVSLSVWSERERDASPEEWRKALLDLYGIGPASVW